jgi:glycosyltransferase involved in cell wall biosynthesis
VRLAWTGPTPNERSGVNYIITQQLEGLAGLGFEIDVYITSSADSVPNRLAELPQLRFISVQPPWDWGRWYSRTALTAFFSGQGARVAGQARLVQLLRARHAEKPYDLVYQASQIELFALRAAVRGLPPLVVHPHTHAAGELRGLRQERHIADACASPVRNRTVEAFMGLRAAIQRRDVHLTQRLITPSARFADVLAADYDYPRERIEPVFNPIDLERHTPAAPQERPPRQRILFISRLAVRKGVEMIVELSHRLTDLEGQVELLVIGNKALWSDYTALVDDLNGRVGRYMGQLSPDELADLYRSAALVVQPSHFEPFGLTIGEGLATGVPTVASDAVGAAEDVDAAVCRQFAAGDMDGFEAAVRGALADGRSSSVELGARARSEATRLFAPAVVTQRLAEVLERTAAGR